MKPSDIIKQGIRRRALEIKGQIEDYLYATITVADSAALSSALLEIAVSRTVNTVGSEDTIAIVQQVISKLQAEQDFITRLIDADAQSNNGGSE